MFSGIHFVANLQKVPKNLMHNMCWEITNFQNNRLIFQEQMSKIVLLKSVLGYKENRMICNASVCH